MPWFSALGSCRAVNMNEIINIDMSRAICIAILSLLLPIPLLLITPPPLHLFLISLLPILFLVIIIRILNNTSTEFYFRLFPQLYVYNVVRLDHKTCPSNKKAIKGLNDLSNIFITRTIEQPSAWLDDPYIVGTERSVSTNTCISACVLAHKGARPSVGTNQLRPS